METNYSQRRENLWSQIPEDYVVVCTNEEATYSRDLKHPFRPNSNMIYLTGCTRPNAVALLSRRDNTVRLFEEADLEGFVLSVKSLDKVAISYEPATFSPARSRVHRAVLPYLKRWTRCAKAIYALRVCKSDAEIRMIRSACRATAEAMKMCQAITEMMPRIRETELEAWIRLSFAQNAAECCAFESIVAVDDHALDWHHTPTTRPINNRILVDIGARKAFYCADMTRTWATGVPTQEFQWMLDAVKDAHRAALEQCRPGKRQLDVEKAAQASLAQTCKTHQIRGTLGKCPHDVTHWVGLDVHDVGQKQLCFVKNMVLAVEPALYINDIGVRWEDTVRITESGYEILTDCD